jgi:hypothetical protein
MIAFVCKECGKRYERPPEQSGSLVFCECGVANRVPWESAAVPRAAEASVPEAIPLAQPIPRAVPVEDPSSALEPRHRSRRRDSTVCFNHPEVAAAGVCTACGEGFCADCTVVLQGQNLCGPCKNFQIRTLEMPARLSNLAIVSSVVALAGGFFTLFLLPVGVAARSASNGVAAFLGILGLVPPLVAVVLALNALRKLENDSRLSGRVLAMTAMVMALISTVLAIEFSVLVLRVNP